MKRTTYIAVLGFMAGLAAAAAGDGETGLPGAVPHDAVFASQPVELASGFRFTEGPVWHPDGYWLFSDIPANTIHRVTPDGDVDVFRADSGQANGLTLDRNGRLVACEHRTRRLTVTEADGTITVLAEFFHGRRFNSPNDCAVRSDGTVFFTDPTYGLRGRPPEVSCKGVYSAARGEEEPVLLVDDFNMPNGIAFSPDETALYIADTAENHVRRFHVDSRGTLSDGQVFCEVRSPDGMKVDGAGRLFVTSREGVAVVAPAGNRVAVLELPQQPANCAFGGPEGRTLCITARSAVYTVRLVSPGIVPGRAGD